MSAKRVQEEEEKSPVLANGGTVTNSKKRKAEFPTVITQGNAKKLKTNDTFEVKGKNQSYFP
jgi:hypothetical protein